MKNRHGRLAPGVEQLQHVGFCCWVVARSEFGVVESLLLIDDKERGIVRVDHERLTSRNVNVEFEKLSLHDATVSTISYQWEAGLVAIIGTRYNSVTHAAVKYTLFFYGVRFLSIPHSAEWGESNSILDLSRVNNSEFRIQMQSGDLVAITAERFSLEQ